MLSNGSGTVSKAKGAKQAGRRRSRESKEEHSLSKRSGAEEEVEDEPSAKRSVHSLQLPQHPYVTFLAKAQVCAIHTAALLSAQ